MEKHWNDHNYFNRQQAKIWNRETIKSVYKEYIKKKEEWERRGIEGQLWSIYIQTSIPW